MTLPVNPKTVTVTLSRTNVDPNGGAPIPFVAGESVTGIDVQFAPVSLDANGAPMPPADSAYTIKASVPAADVAKQDANGVVTFPLSDLAAVLAAGNYALRATETESPEGTTSAPSAPAFFNLAPLVPVPPTVAVA